MKLITTDDLMEVVKTARTNFPPAQGSYTEVEIRMLCTIYAPLLQDKIKDRLTQEAKDIKDKNIKAGKDLLEKLVYGFKSAVEEYSKEGNESAGAKLAKWQRDNRPNFDSPKKKVGLNKDDSYIPHTADGNKK
jgi:hypothetical protein